MPKLATVSGVLKMLWQHTKEDWDEMDHKLLRIAGGVVGFVLMALLWYFFFRNMGPF